MPDEHLPEDHWFRCERCDGRGTVRDAMIDKIGRFIDWWLCKMQCHRWSHPGGHCESCGACDLFFGPHDPSTCESERKMNKEKVNANT